MSNPRAYNIKILYCIFISFLSAFVLAVAFYIDRVLDYAPCPLCIYERVPYCIALIIGIIGFMKKEKIKNIIFIPLILCFLAGSIISFYHSGIEKHWWDSVIRCQANVNFKDLENLENFQREISHIRLADCSKPTFFILGISLTDWNLLLNLVLLFNAYYMRNKSEKTNFQ